LGNCLPSLGSVPQLRCTFFGRVVGEEEKHHCPKGICSYDLQLLSISFWERRQPLSPLHPNFPDLNIHLNDKSTQNKNVTIWDLPEKDEGACMCRRGWRHSSTSQLSCGDDATCFVQMSSTAPLSSLPACPWGPAIPGHPWLPPPGAGAPGSIQVLSLACCFI
jgi:hypothetical protein